MKSYTKILKDQDARKLSTLNKEEVRFMHSKTILNIRLLHLQYMQALWQSTEVLQYNPIQNYSGLKLLITMSSDRS